MTPTTTQAEQNPRLPVNSLADQLAQHYALVIGIDGEGQTHAYFPGIDVIRVYESTTTIADDVDWDSVMYEYDLEKVGKSLEDWIEYVSLRRGEWTETTHHAPGGVR